MNPDGKNRSPMYRYKRLTKSTNDKPFIRSCASSNGACFIVKWRVSSCLRDVRSGYDDAAELSLFLALTTLEMETMVFTVFVLHLRFHEENSQEISKRVSEAFPQAQYYIPHHPREKNTDYS